MKKKILIISSALFIVLYLFASRPHWFSELEQQIDVGKETCTSETLDISKLNTFRWNISRKEWRYREGKAHLNIVLDRKDDIPAARYNKEGTPLRIKVAAYGVLRNNEKANRLIKNWYFLSDEPFSPGLSMGVSYGQEAIEYLLAGIDIYPYEKTIIEVQVLVPDEQLAKANPRLQLVGKHDYAVFGHIGVLRMIRDGGLLVSIIALLFLTINSLKTKKHNKSIQ